MAKHIDAKHQVALQRKIFTRWINQKLVPAGEEAITDCVDDFKDGFHLTKLVEVLSETPSNLAKLGRQTARVKMIDQAARALDYCWTIGVEMVLKTSAENLVDSEEQNVLALVWAIMLRFLKFGDDDDEEKLNAEDALKMWCENQSGMKITNFPKSFQNGLFFCKIIGKYRPKILDASQCTPEDVEGNLTKAFAAAQKCFQLEPYLEVGDVGALDSKSMLVYVAEYYLGAGIMRKTDLACRRVTKLVNYTRINDEHRAKYSAGAGPLRASVDDALARLKAHDIDNTMAGAKKNMEDFESYKANEKGKNISNFLDLENVFSTLLLRLADHERPVYSPGETLTPAELQTTLTEIDAAEKTKSVALVAELNRQIKLANLYERHQEIATRLTKWTNDKLAYLNTKETVDSSGSAKYHINRLGAYKSEAESTVKTSWTNLQALGAQLLEGSFEHSDTVKSSEKVIADALAEMEGLAASKQATLDDDLKRELYKENIQLLAEQYKNKYGVLEAWINDKLAYTAKKEEIAGVSDAQLQLSLLNAHESGKDDLKSTAVPALNTLAQQLLDASYSSDLSSWEYPAKDDIKAKEAFVSDSWDKLAEQSAQKKLVLEDDLAREKFIEEIRLNVLEHVERCNKLNAWVAVQDEYLSVREEIDTVDKAQIALYVLEAYEADKSDLGKTSVPSFKNLGQKIITAEYKTDLSQWTSPDVDDTKAREADIDSKWASLTTKSAEKKTFLDAELARELKKEELRLTMANLGGNFMLWAGNHRDDVTSTHFGFSLEEVQEYGSKLTSSNAELSSEGDSKLAAYTAVDEEAKGIGMVDNRYTTVTLQDMTDLLTKLKEACDERKAKYDTELARQQSNDALDHEFSDLVESIVKKIDSAKADVASSRGSKELEEQEELVKGLLADAGLAEQVPKVKELDAKIKEADFRVRHTTLTALDVEITWLNFQVFLTAKAEALAAEILHKELRGVSLEEYEEIQKQFNQFDKNDNGALDPKEFQSCLYSLGEETPRKKAMEIMEKYGGNKDTIDYDGFKEFIITQLGDTDSKEEIETGFKLINSGADVAKEDLMLELLKDEDVAWIISQAPKVGDDYDYKALSEALFAR